MKLRSDCVRECVGDFEADTPEAREALRQRDVQDLGFLLLRCFGLDCQKTTSKPPSPFDRVIPQMLDGTLKADGIITALNPPATTLRTQPLLKVATVTTAVDCSSQPSKPVYANTPKVVDSSASESERLSTQLSTEYRRTLRRDSLQNIPTTSTGSDHTESNGWVRIAASHKVWFASACAMIMFALIVWGTFGTTKHASSASTGSKVLNLQPAASQVPNAAIATKPSAIVERKQTHRSLLAAGVQAGWHVIAYTYNYEQQATAKVNQLNRRYDGLQPQVFSPTGRAPYFVALGGSTDAAKAMALRNRARQIGLPLDTYARNF